MTGRTWHFLFSVGRRSRSLNRSKLGVSAHPRVTALEDRCVPTVLPPGDSLTGLGGGADNAYHMGPLQEDRTAPFKLKVTYLMNSPTQEIDLLEAFKNAGVKDAEDREMVVLGNNNSDLLKVKLLDTDLQVKIEPGKTGTATITVMAVDAAGLGFTMEIEINVVNALGPQEGNSTTNLEPRANNSSPTNAALIDAFLANHQPSELQIV